MKAVIDTNSLLALVRYLLPFDSEKRLFNFFRDKLREGDFIIIDAVWEECRYTAKGLALSRLGFLQDKKFLKAAKLPHKTDILTAPAPAKFLRQFDSQFVNAALINSKGISDAELENQKNSFLRGADMRQIILCLNLIKAGEQVVLVTEETEGSNDNKLFKKIPAICKLLDINTLSLPELLLNHEGFDIHFR